MNDPLARFRGRQNALKGKATEQVVKYRLQSMGFVQVARIETGWRIMRGPKGKIINAAPIGKVHADFTAVEPGTGRLVVCEVKNRPDPLCWSDIEPHQIHNLNTYVQARALAFLAWCCNEGLFMLQWPVPGLIPGHSLSHERAAELSQLTTHDRIYTLPAR